VTEHEQKALALAHSIGLERLGDVMYKSGFFTDARSQAQAIVKILAGAELDFGPVASMNGIYIINGRTTLSANLVAAAIQRSGRYKYRVIEQTDQLCTLDFFEVVGGKPELLGRSTFTMQDARAAGLEGTTNWRKFPRNMLWSRAMTNGARWYTPDVFSGPVYSPEELGAEVDETGTLVQVYEEPQQKVVPLREREVEDQPRPQVVSQQLHAADVIVSADDRAWKRWSEISGEAISLGVRDVPNLTLPLERALLVTAGVQLAADVKAVRDRLAQQDAARDQGRVLHEAWERNHALMAEAYAAGLRLHELPGNSNLQEVTSANADVERLLTERAEHTSQAAF
jgi:hypothetical protein